MKQSNDYARVLDRDLYDKMPKTVLAAIAVSFATELSGDISEAQDKILEEWRILNLNKIVPQKPLIRVTV